MKKRCLEKEWIDLGFDYYTLEEYEDCLYQLDRVGRYLGGDRATFKAFKKLKRPPSSILDVGCGGGLFTSRLAKRFPNANVLGIDISHESIAFAKKQASTTPVKNIEFVIPPTTELEYPPGSFDIITSTLVCHHLPDNALIQFLKRAYAIANQAVILNDLHRHPLASMAFALIRPLLFRNRVVKNDGPLSIKRSFTRRDWIYYLNAAEIPLERCSIEWHWAFRWIVSIDTSKK